MTREEYLAINPSPHREYWGQFVNEGVKKKVLSEIGLERLMKSKDIHLNDIPMKKWDWLGGFIMGIHNGTQEVMMRPQTPYDLLPVDFKLLKKMGEGVSPASMVCIYKEAGRQIIEENGRKLENF